MNEAIIALISSLSTLLLAAAAYLGNQKFRNGSHSRQRPPTPVMLAKDDSDHLAAMSASLKQIELNQLLAMGLLTRVAEHAEAMRREFAQIHGMLVKQ